MADRTKVNENLISPPAFLLLSFYSLVDLGEHQTIIRTSFFPPPPIVVNQNRALQNQHREHMTGTEQTLGGEFQFSLSYLLGPD